MRKYSDRLFKIACGLMAALLLFQLLGLVVRRDPLTRLTIPTLPSLATASDTLPGTKATNSIPRSAAVKKETNAAARMPARAEGTNPSGPARPPAVGKETNATPSSQPRAKATMPSASARPPAGRKETNAAPGSQPRAEATMPSGAPSRMGPTTAGGSRSPGGPPDGRSGNPGFRPGPTRQAPELSPALRARVERITQSEIFAPVMRPLPMALLGIGDQSVFLRAPNGQTGLVKEGEELGGIKLVRIGTNRVLIEQEGEQKELMIFSGYGGESLLQKRKDGPQ
jgi:hypothetical protein